MRFQKPKLLFLVDCLVGWLVGWLSYSRFSVFFFGVAVPSWRVLVVVVANRDTTHHGYGDIPHGDDSEEMLWYPRNGCWACACCCGGVDSSIWTRRSKLTLSLSFCLGATANREDPSIGRSVVVRCRRREDTHDKSMLPTTVAMTMIRMTPRDGMA